jgi:hypothetical protein
MRIVPRSRSIKTAAPANPNHCATEAANRQVRLRRPSSWLLMPMTWLVSWRVGYFEDLGVFGASSRSTLAALWLAAGYDIVPT